MSDKQGATNVISFPGKRKGAEETSAPQPSAPVPPAHPPRAGRAVLNVGGGLLAIVLATVAVNRYVYRTETSDGPDLASRGANARVIASVARELSLPRDAAWEKNLAERLAATSVTGDDPARVGRGATLEERLRWGVLEQKYDIRWRVGVRQIKDISRLSNEESPSFLFDRAQFLSEFGVLIEASFASQKLRSTERVGDQTVESYWIYDDLGQARAEARFELDSDQRLIRLNVEPIRI